MGATWAIIFLWFHEKWDEAVWQELTGVDIPVWLEGPDPPNHANAYQISRANLATFRALAASVSAAENISAARQVWAKASKASKDIASAYFRHVMSRPTWQVSREVHKVFNEHRYNAAAWARSTQRRKVRLHISHAYEPQLMLQLCGC